MPRIAIPMPVSPDVQPTSADLPAELPRLHRQLEEQRRFRMDQLAQLAALRGAAQIEVAGRHLDDLDASADNARIEVSAAVESAARLALDDIEAALDRMREGRYGSCDQCQA